MIIGVKIHGAVVYPALFRSVTVPLELRRPYGGRSR